jgi:NTP pyrophosphatase (non-canonical NTP hydrolase)
MVTLPELQNRYAEFVSTRGWEQFHTPKNLAEAISIESNELLECFLWHDNLDPAEIKADEELMAQVEDELADIIIYCMGMASRLDIDLLATVESKMGDNETRFDEDTTRSINQNLRRWQRRSSE